MTNYKRQSLINLRGTHNDLLTHYSKTLDAAEEHLRNITFCKLIDSTIIASEEYRAVNELVTALTNIVPYLVEVTVLEQKLDELSSIQ